MKIKNNHQDNDFRPINMPLSDEQEKGAVKLPLSF